MFNQQSVEAKRSLISWASSHCDQNIPLTPLSHNRQEWTSTWHPQSSQSFSASLLIRGSEFFTGIQAHTYIEHSEGCSWVVYNSHLHLLEYVFCPSQAACRKGLGPKQGLRRWIQPPSGQGVTRACLDIVPSSQASEGDLGRISWHGLCQSGSALQLC